MSKAEMNQRFIVKFNESTRKFFHLIEYEEKFNCMNHEKQEKKKKNMYMIIYSLFFPMNTRAICLPTKTH